jgi:drug/metabolite transporter (DMT)-like permease
LNQKKLSSLTGIIFTVIGSVLFACKAVLVKLIYLEQSLSVSAVLTIRMLLALPFYIVILIIEQRKYKQQHNTNPATNTFLQAAGVGLLGYYASSYFDFWGLKYVSAGLERIILYTYPAMVLIFAALFYRQQVKRWQIPALLLTYAGVALAFLSDIKLSNSSNQWLGSTLIFFCAITYALYVLFSGQIIPKMGSNYFVSVAIIAATFFMVLHFTIQHGSINMLFNISKKSVVYFLIMAVFSTVVPTLLIGGGVKRIGSSNVGIASSIGPLATIILAWYFLGEKVGVLQIAGTALVIAGILWLSFKVQKN